ncbi:MAG: GHKL domain-containing protein [Deltaproteobacteria bacterium]|nr:GHKL domain-containing protein [Deltaproteobacteria bacterium]
MPAELRGLTFRTRVLAYLLAFILLLTLALGTVLVRSQQASLRMQFEDEGRTLAHLLANSVRLDVFASDHEALLRSVAPVLQNRNVEQVVVLDATGEVLMNTGGSHDVSERVPVAEMAAAGDAPGARDPRGLPRVVWQEDGERIVFWREVLDRLAYETPEELYFEGLGGSGGGASVLGYVAVVLSKERLRRETASVVRRMAAVGGGFFLLGGVLAFLVSREAARPLARLVEAFRDQGITVESQDELGALRDTFTSLVTRLERAFATIQELKEGLEQKVAERTRELARANEELRRARDLLEERVRERTAQLEAMHRHLRQTEKLSAVGKLAASLAHEINNPVFGVRNVLQELQRKLDLDPEDAELVALSIEECNRIAKLVRSLREFNRPSSEVPAWVDVHSSIGAMLTLCRKRFSRQRIRVETSYSPEVGRVFAIEDQLKQVILNLLTNAAEALPEEGGTIRVSTSASNGVVRIRVEDTGCGIPEENLERIFEPFFTTKSAASGTGLGLSVCYGIVERHGGRIQVESRVGEGTAFTVELPIGEEGNERKGSAGG